MSRRTAACEGWCAISIGVYREDPALHQVDYEAQGFQWIDCNDNENSVISLIRRARDPQNAVVAVFNWTPVVRSGYRMGVPDAGIYREVVNTDADIYGGGNVGNAGQLQSEAIPAHGFPQSVSLTLPPLAGLILKRL